ncbi:MAG: HEAT repeat domain-containing protein [Verrucomicrobiia bacterium]
MKRNLTAFVGGILVGGAVVTAYFAASGKLMTATPTELSSPVSAVPLHGAAHPIHKARRQDTIQRDKQTASNPVPPDSTSAPTQSQHGQSSEYLTVQFIPPQYLPQKLQDALRQYPTLDGKDKREALANDVLGMTDAGASGPEVAQVLETMFRQEANTEIKLDILDDLTLLDEPYTIVPFIEGIDPSQPQEVRTKAMRALGNLGDQQAVPFLQQFLGDQNSEIREAAQSALDDLTTQ